MMYALPPRPIFQTSAPLWLLTLVDRRYLWYFLASDLIVPDASITWVALIASISIVLGISLTFEQAVPAAYLKVPVSITSHYQYLPPLLDAIAYSTGTRLVMKLTGTASVLRNAVTAKQVNDAQVAASGRVGNAVGIRGGGLFRFDASKKHDLNFLPSSVTVRFPWQKFGLEQQTPYAINTTLASLALPEFKGAGVTGDSGATQLIHSSACYRDVTDNDGGNLAEMTALAKQITTDYYRWRTPRVEARLDGIVAWQPDGFSDIDWYHGAGVFTTIRRPSWNSEPLDLCHASTPGGDTSGYGISLSGGLSVAGSSRHGGTGAILFGKPVASDMTFSTLARRNVQIGQVSISGITANLNIPDCTLLQVFSSLGILTGIANPASCMEVHIFNVGPDQLNIGHLDSSSLPQNQIRCPNGAPYSVAPNGGVTLCYSQNLQNWCVIETDGASPTIAARSTVFPLFFDGLDNGASIYIETILDFSDGLTITDSFCTVDRDGTYLLGFNLYATVTVEDEEFASVTFPSSAGLLIEVFHNGEVIANQDGHANEVVPIGSGFITFIENFHLSCSGIAKAVAGDSFWWKITILGVSNIGGAFSIDVHYGDEWIEKIK